jgi:hypothetical protein
VDLLVVIYLILRMDSDGVSVILANRIISIHGALLWSIVRLHTPWLGELVFHWVLHRWLLVHAGECLR